MSLATRLRASHLVPLALVAACLAAGCGRDDKADATAGGDPAAANLPRPEAGAGSVTGMPGARADGRSAPEPATTGNPFDLSGDAPQAFDEDGNPLPPEDVVAQAPADAIVDPTAAEGAAAPAPAPDADAVAAAPGEPTPDDAAAVVRRYYGAIDARQYEQAYQLWSGDGRSSGQSAASFAGGFGDTAGVTVQTGTPGRVEAAAGSRYVRVPVSIRAVGVDGSERRYEGSYTLRRAVVDGATDAQRDWRIESADLREVSR
jgi:hypothetical protein